MDLCILTDPRFIEYDPALPLYRELAMEESILNEAFREAGLQVETRSWDDPEMDWSSTPAALFRSTWDYQERLEAFLPWLEKTAGLTRFINDAEIIKWNLDKHYLLDLGQKGLPIPPSRFLDRGESTAWSDIIAESAWDEIILKPAISAGAHHTYRFRAEEYEEYEEIYRGLVAKQDMMIQEFQEKVLSRGEISLVMINGRYSHSVLKKAKAGDFRVQEDFGGSVQKHEATEDEITFAEKALICSGFEPLYARVDLIWDNAANLVLSELELIEPELWFRLNPGAAFELAARIKQNFFQNDQ